MDKHIYRIIGVGSDPGGDLVQRPAKAGYLEYLHRKVSGWGLNMSREGDSTASLSSLFRYISSNALCIVTVQGKDLTKKCRSNSVALNAICWLVVTHTWSARDSAGLCNREDTEIIPSWNIPGIQVIAKCKRERAVPFLSAVEKSCAREKEKGPLGPTEAEDFPSISEISLGWLLRWAVLVQKDIGRENCFSELPVQKNTESVFTAKFQKDSIKGKLQKHNDKFLFFSVAYPTHITSEDRALGPLYQIFSHWWILHCSDPCTCVPSLRAFSFSWEREWCSLLFLEQRVFFIQVIVKSGECNK